MEVPRMMLAIAGKFPGDYLDGRYTTEEAKVTERCMHFDTIKDTLSSNLGRMPVMVDGGQAVGQSVAINYYIASSCGLFGKSLMEGAQILAIQEHLKEMMTAFRGIVPYGAEPSDEQLDKWFNSGVEDASPAPADMSKRSERMFKWWTGRIEAVVGEGGFAVGGAISLADVLIYYAFAEFLRDEEALPTMAQFRREAFCSKARTDARLAECPKLQAICSTVAEQPGIRRWLAERGTQKF